MANTRTVEDYREEEALINQENPWGDNDPNDMELAFDIDMQEII